MNQLFPIIRRKRRPLLPEDAPPVTVGNVEPPKVEATGSNVTNSTDGMDFKARTDDENVSTPSEPR